jgi:hypothetical protein
MSPNIIDKYRVVPGILYSMEIGPIRKIIGSVILKRVTDQHLSPARNGERDTRRAGTTHSRERVRFESVTLKAKEDGETL